MKNIIFICLGLYLFSISNAHAAKITVEWKDPDKYMDIHSGNTQGKQIFRNQLFSELEQTFSAEADAIPEQYHMKIVMIDVDLAGAVDFGKSIEVRRINDFDFPRLKFYMFLYDQNDNILLQGVQNLKEKKDKHNAFRMKGSQTSFYLEKDLIKKWFAMAVVPAVQKI